MDHHPNVYFSPYVQSFGVWNIIIGRFNFFFPFSVFVRKTWKMLVDRRGRSNVGRAEYKIEVGREEKLLSSMYHYTHTTYNRFERGKTMSFVIFTARIRVVVCIRGRSLSIPLSLQW